MIVVDTSVIVAVIRKEPDASVWTDILDRTSRAVMSVVSHVETGIVIAGRRADAELFQVNEVLRALSIDVIPVTLAQGVTAIEAFLKYGKGRHPARLNLADCFSYSLAKSQNVPLLFKGGDFTKTDIVPVWRP
ncbi:MAG TPA: type II toxin-antitoxin system VapC family toxin [Xanthobacteraceae bacterium]|jgi:ribonuclease VapC